MYGKRSKYLPSRKLVILCCALRCYLRRQPLHLLHVEGLIVVLTLVVSPHVQGAYSWHKYPFAITVGAIQPHAVAVAVDRLCVIIGLLLARAFQLGKHGVPQDLAQAKVWYRKVVDEECDAKHLKRESREKAKDILQSLSSAE